MNTNITINANININSDNEIISEVINSMVEEAIKHFTTTSRPRNYHSDDDNRYFYTKEEVEMFIRKYKGPKVNIYTILDDCDSSVFCYEITRIH